MGAAVVLGGRPGDDVGAVVRARASVLAVVELERLNLQQKVGDEAWKEGGEGGRDAKHGYGGVVGGGGGAGQRDSRIRCLEDKKPQDGG